MGTVLKLILSSPVLQQLRVTGVGTQKRTLMFILKAWGGVRGGDFLRYLVIVHCQMSCTPNPPKYSISNGDQTQPQSCIQTCRKKKKKPKTTVDPHQGFSNGLGGEGHCSCKTSETTLKWSRERVSGREKLA